VPPSAAKAKKQPWYRFLVGPTLRTNDLGAAFRGDGAVPLDSMAGYNHDGSPVFTNLAPVDIRGYEHTNGNLNATNWIADHGSSIHHFGIYQHLLDGIQYKTVGFVHPDGPGNWSGLQKEYTNSPIQNASGTTFTHTDEPGIADLKLLYLRTGQNALLISSLNTFSTNSTGPQKTVTNANDFVGHQIVASSGSNVRYIGVTGTKNRSQNPVATNGADYWVVSGNEYLPASLKLSFTNGVTPRTVATNTTMLSNPLQIVTNCLVQLDGSGAPQYQYGYFENSLGVSITASTNNFVAAQGYNLAALLTPQAERAFGAVVDSPTLVAILKKINEAEALSNACHNADTITRWQTTVSEWARSDTGTITLNFFPTISTPSVRDAWTNAVFHVSTCVSPLSR
jgi:hypothetical protein